MSRFPHLNTRRDDSLSTTRPNGVRVTVAFDYIAVPIGNGRSFTSNRSGGTVKGAVPKNVTDAWFRLVDGKAGTLVERINAFVDDLDTLWPEWNKAPDTSKYTIGYKGVWKLGPRKPEQTYEIVGLPAGRKSKFTVRVEGQNWNTIVDGDFLNNHTIRDAR